MSVMKSIKINKNGKILIKIYKNELDFNKNLTHFFLPYQTKVQINFVQIDRQEKQKYKEVKNLKYSLQLYGRKKKKTNKN